MGYRPALGLRGGLESLGSWPSLGIMGVIGILGILVCLGCHGGPGPDLGKAWTLPG